MHRDGNGVARQRLASDREAGTVEAPGHELRWQRTLGEIGEKT